MKTLYILRHAKSSWKDPTLDDIDRPLNKRGKRAGAAIANFFRESGIVPDLVLCSTAERTRQTLKFITDVLDGELDVRFEEELYTFGPEPLFYRLLAVDDGCDSVLLVGHNPALHILTLELATNRDSVAYGRASMKFPTAAFATLEFDGGWMDLDVGTCRLTSLVLPRELEQAE